MIVRLREGLAGASGVLDEPVPHRDSTSDEIARGPDDGDAGHVSRTYIGDSACFEQSLGGCCGHRRDAIAIKSATTSSSGRLASSSCVQPSLRSGSTSARSAKIIARSTGVFP